MAKKLKIYNGSSWEDVTFAITPPNTAVTNSFTTNQVIDASTSVAALRITQRGTGEAFRVEDDTNPDSSPFIITSDGLVGIGTTIDATVRTATNVGARLVTRDGGILIENYNLDSGVTVARAGGTSSSPTQALLNNRVAYFIGSSYGSSSFNNNVAMNFYAAENITDIARGSYITFDTTTIGTVGRAERIRITDSGRLGIGTTSPTDRLDILVPAGVDSGIRFTLTSGGLPLGQMTVNSSSGEVKVGGVDAGAGNYYLGLYTLGTQRVRIDANGQVNITNSNLIINSASSVTGANWDQGMLHLTGINSATSHPGLSWHAPGASAMSIFHTRGTQSLEVRGNGNIVDITSGRMTIRNIAISTSAPSGGLDGDMWAVYV